MLHTLLYIQWMCVGMNINSMSSIFIKSQTQSNISLSLSLAHLLIQPSCPPPPPSSLSSPLLCTSVYKIFLLTFLTNLSWYCCIYIIFCFIPFTFIRLPLSLSFKLLICFGGEKWAAHRWPNFSVDFPKLISCCILAWIPNEICVKIGKSLICWNGKILLFFFPFFFTPSVSLSVFFLCYLLWMNIYCESRPNFQYVTCLCSIFYCPATPRTGWVLTQTQNHCTTVRDKIQVTVWTNRKHTKRKRHTQT